MRTARMIISVSLLAALCSCGNTDSISLAREDLFTLNLGKMENQLDFFFDENSPRLYKNDVFFDEGIFYITNGNARKLMEFTPFGDLTLLLYNPDQNPLPVLLRKEI